MKSLIALAFTCVVASGALAQELADYQSRDFATQSETALKQGDRAAAILQALRGLPADPTEDDIARFEGAYDALVRASVSRAVRLDLPAIMVFSFGPNGARLTSSGQGFAEGGDQSKYGLKLWDPRNGSVVADLLPIEDLTTGGWGVQAAEFSPDGSIFVQMAPPRGEAVVFDAETGAEVTRLGGLPTGLMTHSPGLAFSSDGQRLLTATGGMTPVAVLWDTSTWQEVARASFAGTTLMVPIDGGRDGAMHLIAFDIGAGTPPPTALWELSGAGARKVTDMVSEASGIGSQWGKLPTDDADRFFSLQNGAFDSIVYERATGTEVARVSASVVGQSTPFLAPSGDGIIVLDSATGSPRRFAFDGTEEPLRPLDKLADIHGVFSPGGEMIGGTVAFQAYRGEDMPRGRELYDFVWSAIPDELKTEIEAERVTLE